METSFRAGAGKPEDYYTVISYSSVTFRRHGPNRNSKLYT